jgi:hypothetical protein
VLFATHLLVAGLLASARRLPAPALVFGAALPDLVDKSLASLGVVDLFHTVGHSALLAPLALLVALRGPQGVALALGWASHLLLDALHIVVNGRPTDAYFLAWPLIEPPTPLAIPPGEFFWYYLWSPSFFLEVGIWLFAAVVAVRWLRGREAPA